MVAISRGKPNWITRLLASLIPDTTAARAERLDRDLNRAGYYRPAARAEFLAARNLMVLLGIALFAFALLLLIDRPRVVVNRVIVAGVVMIVTLYIVPRLWLQAAGNSRVQRILDGLPDVLDMLTMCVDGGLPLHDALARVKTRIRGPHPELAAELDIVHRQAEMGAPENAIHAFARRIDEPDVYSLAEVVTHAERTGSDVGSALSDHADSIRKTMRHRAEQRGNLMSVKLLFPIMFCLTPAAYLLLLAPSAVELRQFMLRENQPGGALDVSTTQRSIERRVTRDSALTPQQIEEANSARNELLNRPRQGRAAPARTDTSSALN